MAVGCFRDSTAPRAFHTAALAVAPSFSTHAARVVEFDHVRIVLHRASGAVALDTSVIFPDTSDQISLLLSVPLEAPSGSETFSVTLAMTSGADTVFRGGPTPVTVTVGVLASAASLPLRYSGVGANAASVAMAVKDTSLFFTDSVTLAAVASDSAGKPIPGTPIEWETPDSTLVRLPSAAGGKVIALSQRGVARIVAETPTGLADTARVTVQPRPAALSVVSGASQSATVGTALAQPVVLQAKGADGLGVRGVAVSLAVTGGGTVLKASDTTDANGNVTVAWTLGGTPGTQTLTATLAATPAITTTAAATGVVGAPKKLVFQVQPTTATALEALSPAVQVAAQDTFGNVVPGYAELVTMSIGSNPAGAILGGTTTVRAVAGVATFADLTLNLRGTGYTLVAAAEAITAATSAPFSILMGPRLNEWINAAGGSWSTAANWSRGTVPVATDSVQIKLSGTYTVNVDADAAFTNLDVGAPGGTQTLVVSAGTLTAGDGLLGASTVLNLGGGTIGGAGTLSVAGAFIWSAGGFNGAGGKISVLPSGTLLIAPATGALFQNYTIELAGSGIWTGSTAIAASNAALRLVNDARLDIQGDPSLTFNGYYPNPPALNVMGVLTRTTSAGVAVIGGPLNDSGTVNVQTGTLRLAGGGTSAGWYDVAAGAALEFAGGTHTLSASSKVRGPGTVSVTGGSTIVDGGWAVAGSTLIAGGTAAFNGMEDSVETVAVSSGTLGGAGVLTVVGSMSWTGGNLNGSGGKAHVIWGASLSIAPAAGVLFQNYALDLDGSGTWTGNAAIAASNAVVHVADGATLDIQGDVSLNNNGYYPKAPALDVASGGVLKRTTGTGVVHIGGPLNDSGSVSVQTGTLRLAGGGTSPGAFRVVDPGALDFGGGTHTLGATSRIAGYGTVSFSGGTANLDGTYAVGGPALVAGGTANFNDLRDTTGSLTVSSGTLGGSGLLVVLGPMSWTGGNLNGSAGTVRVYPGGTLSIAPAAGVLFQNYTVELAGNGVWTGNATIAASNAVIRVSGLLDIRGNPSLDNNGYYPNPPAVNVVGSLIRTTSAGVATIGGPLNDSGRVSVQTGTLRLAGGGLGGTGFTVQPGATLDLAGGTWTVGTNMTWSFGGSLKVSGGSLVLNGSRTSVGENFATAGSGVLVVADGDSLGVRRDVTFGGGNSAGSLSGGYITVGRNFSQIGAGAVFAPTGTSVWLTGDTAFQAIQFADPVGSSFYDLHASPMAWDTLRLLSDVRVRNNLASGGKAEVVSATTQRLRVDGTLDMPLEGDRLGLVHPFVLELQHAPSLGLGYYSTALSPDTTVFFGAGGFDFPSDSRIQFNHVRVAAAAPLAWTCNECNGVLGDMVMGGPASTYGAVQVVPNASLNIGGKLKTEGQGVLVMDSTAGSVYVGDSAIFAGGRTAGLLKGGNLELYGDLHVPVPGAFSPSGGHLTDFIGDGTQSVWFAAPDTAATASHFNMLYVWKLYGDMQFLSSAHVLSDLQIVGETAVPIAGHSGDSLTAFGNVWLQTVRFDSLSLVTKVPSWATASVSGVTFGDYDPSVTQFYLEQPGDSVVATSLNNLTFVTDLPPEVAGWHFVASDADGLTPFLTVNLYATWPPPNYGKFDARNGARVQTAF